MPNLRRKNLGPLRRGIQLFGIAALGAVCQVVVPRCASQTLAQSSQTTSKAIAPYTPPKLIDFSSKHAVAIQNQDGTLTPMDVPYYRSELIAPGTWRIETDGDYSYLLEGDNEALAIDAGYGAGNIREYLQTLTKKPVRYVANTHYHFDHTANDAYFDGAYVSAETAEKATIPYPSFSGISFPRNYPKIIIRDGYIIQLGNREVDVLIIPNHTPGGTAFLDKRERILFSGDEIFQGNVNISDGSSVSQYDRNMTKLEARRKEFDQLATGGFGVIDAVWVEKYLANTRYILAGHEGEPVTRRMGPPPASPQDASGVTTYRRRFPRPGDSAGPPSDTPLTDLRKMTYEGCGITYNVHHIEN